MRTAAGFFFIALASSGFPVGAQMDEKPPVLKRGGSGIPSTDPNSTDPNGRGSGASKTDSSKSASNKDPDVIATAGIIRRIDEKAITVEAEDTRLLTCKLSASTKYSGPGGKLTLDDFDPGMHVKIEARYASDRESLNAVSLTLENPVEHPPVDHPKDLKTATAEGPPDEEGRPILRRGIPAKRNSSDDDDDSAIASAKPTAASTPDAAAPTSDAVEPEAKLKVRDAGPDADAFIEKARDEAAEFSSKLPNFVSQQFTTRYERESKADGWRAKDIISATVVYMDGKEEYQNIKVGNRAGPKDMMDIKGQSSNGDFNTTLDSMMDRSSGAEFHFVKDAEFKHLKAKVYDFAVTHERSNWQIKIGGQSLLAAYSGRVWVDRESGRVLRLERQAEKIPEAFPMDLVEQTVEYDFVRLGSRKVLLPTQSENLSCQRGTSFCGKNEIEFRNYREFRGEATIEFEK